MRVVIVMTYLDRQFQLNRTLESMTHSTFRDFEVLIMDDGSKKEIELAEYPFKVTVVKTENKTWVNGVPAYNKGFQLALERKPEIIIIQNAECYHVGDVISYSLNVTDKQYLAFGCFSIDKEITNREHDIFEEIDKCNHRAREDGKTGWYIHPRFRPQPFHFCAAIKAENLRKLNGFDERFSYGYAFEDVYFVDQIRKLGLRSTITALPLPVVVHQYHYEDRYDADFIRMVGRNAVIYKQLKADVQYRAKHTITSNL